MKIDYLYAAIFVSNIKASESFYSKVLDREPDDRPMDTLVQWHGFSNAGIQLFKDATKAGNSTMTIVVSDIKKTELFLKDLEIDLGQTQKGKVLDVANRYQKATQWHLKHSSVA